MLQPVASDGLNKCQAVKPWEEDRSQYRLSQMPMILNINLKQA